ncbi:hypothetical protein [Ignatzschineria sp. LJL83]
MMNEIIKKISVAWDIEKVVFYNKLNPVESMMDVASNKDLLNLDLMTLHWSDLLGRNHSMLKDIEHWYLVDDLFDYFLPAVLIHLLQNADQDDDVLLCFMEKAGNSTLDHHSDLFCHMISYSLDQIDSISSAFSIFEPKKSYPEAVKAFKHSIQWIQEKLSLEEEISEHFQPQKFKKISLLFNPEFFESFDYSYLNILLNASWKDISKEPHLLKIIDYDILQMKQEALIYFLPAYLISSIEKICRDTAILEFSLATIGNSLSYIHSVFTKQQKQILIRYLNLIKNLPDSFIDHHQKQISNILNILTN